jgi:hypothetical protein
MATTGELLAIIEELQLIDAGDAASYFGEEGSGEVLMANLAQEGSSCSQTGVYSAYTASSCEESSFQ